MRDYLFNPLDELAEFSESSLPRTVRQPGQHSSGRRELRQERHSQGITIHHRAATPEEMSKAVVTGQAANVTLPIKRVKEKRGGMTKKEWKRARRAARESASESANNPQE